MTTGSPQPGVVEAAPAKLNLALHVTGLREDGYHELESLVTFCRDACDRIRVENADSDRFSLSGSMAAKIEGGDNLALRARDWLREKRLSDASPVAVHLEKTLPVSSGIGGGSADAAATLRGLCRLWSIEIDTLSMDQLAFDLGADVPMCLKSRPALASGIGERLTRVPAMPEFAVVLVNPGLPVSTPAVFRVLPNKQNPTLPRATPAATDLGSWLAYLASTRNDLEAPAIGLVPEIADILEALRLERALFARMSGSGATCFGIFDTPDAARAAEGSLRMRRPGWYVAATRTTASTEHPA
jgi:4-diphosphocytidyl-2-C-methyl-D-erythritol kinase